MSESSSSKPLQRRKSTPCLITKCLENKIAICDCQVHQTIPYVDIPSPPTTGTSKKKKKDSSPLPGINGPMKSSQPIENFHCEEVLLPSATMTLCLWKDEKEYHLTVFRLEKNELFLDLPLSGLLKGTITYNTDEYLWHEVTIIDDADEKDVKKKPRRLAFNLKSSVTDSAKVKNFNRQLNIALEDSIKSNEVVAGEITKAEVNKGKDSVHVSADSRSCNQTSGLTTTKQAEGVVIKKMATAAPAAVAAQPKVQGPLPGVEASSISPGLPHVPLAASAAQQMAQTLEAAIQSGNVKKAQEIVMALAQGHAPVSVKFDTASHERMAKDKEISVIVHVEDRESAGLILSDIKVRPSDTILDLKRMFLGKHGFPMEVQKWIIGNRICSDEDTLNKCQVSSSGHTLYLYLLNARAVNISRDDYKRRWQARNSQDCEAFNYPMANSSAPRPPSVASNLSQPPSSQDFNLTPPQGLGQGQISPQGSAASRQQSQMSAHSSSSSLTAAASARSLSEGQEFESVAWLVSGQRGSSTRQSQGDPMVATAAVGNRGGGGESRGRLQEAPEVFQSQEEEDESSQGWRCEQCTLINQPTRPGCELCGGSRPANYKVPANYIASGEELARLAREQQMEAAARQGRSHGQGRLGGAAATHTVDPQNPNSFQLNPEDVNELLRLHDTVMSQYGSANQEGSSVDLQETFSPGGSSLLAPSGVRQSIRPRSQNRDYGEDVIDSMGWMLEGDTGRSSHA